MFSGCELKEFGLNPLAKFVAPFAAHDLTIMQSKSGQTT